MPTPSALCPDFYRDIYFRDQGTCGRSRADKAIDVLLIAWAPSGVWKSSGAAGFGRPMTPVLHLVRKSGGLGLQIDVVVAKAEIRLPVASLVRGIVGAVD